MAYCSRKISLAEQNYDIYNKKLLAIIAILKQQRIYAEGTPLLKILTDYKNLLYFIITKVLNKKQMQWLELLK